MKCIFGKLRNLLFSNEICMQFCIILAVNYTINIIQIKTVFKLLRTAWVTFATKNRNFTNKQKLKGNYDEEIDS